MKNNWSKRKQITLLALLFWLLAITASLIWNILQAKEQILILADHEAKINLQRDLAFRRWATGHGGIYVIVSEKAKPNPYLSHIKERDVKTPGGETLTMFNPATMIREINRTQKELYGAITRITALQVLNPINLPDEWEKKALTIIQETKSDYTELTEISGKPFLRKMQPMFMEEGCMKCHAWTGLKVGDIRGATDHSVALEPYYEIFKESMVKMILSHIGIFGFGFCIIMYLSIRGKKVETKLAESDETNKKLLIAIEQSPTTIVISDTDANIQYANPRFTEVTGYTREEVLGKNPKILNSGLTPKVVFDELWATLTSGKNWSGEFINKRKNGEVFFERAYIAPVKNSEGITTNYVAVKLDITDRKKMELDLIRSKVEAEKASKAKSDFLATISHEIRTPIHGILGFNELLLESFPRNDQLTQLNFIEESGRNLLDIINNILIIAELEKETIAPIFSEFSLRILLDEICNKYSNRIKYKNISLNYKFAQGLVDTIYSDKRRIEQIIENLLNNSVKFTETGSVFLEAMSEQVSPEEHILTISVADTGKGITEENRDKIFELFTQEDSSISRKFGGTGLGLAICKKLITMLGGSIQVESKIDIGSKFTFTIRCKSIQANEDKPSLISDKNPLGNLKILVAEDDMINTFIIQKYLASLGYNYLDAAEDGEIALEKLKSKSFDLLLTDLHMPNMNGFELASNVKKIQTDLKIIAITADAYEETRQKCIDLGMSGFMSKPFTKQQLQDVIKKVYVG